MIKTSILILIAQSLLWPAVYAQINNPEFGVCVFKKATTDSCFISSCAKGMGKRFDGAVETLEFSNSKQGWYAVHLGYSEQKKWDTIDSYTLPPRPGDEYLEWELRLGEKFMWAQTSWVVQAGNLFRLDTYHRKSGWYSLCKQEGLWRLCYLFSQVSEEGYFEGPIDKPQAITQMVKEEMDNWVSALKENPTWQLNVVIADGSDEERMRKNQAQAEKIARRLQRRGIQGARLRVWEIHPGWEPADGTRFQVVFSDLQ
jgi:hypothetical protein